MILGRGSAQDDAAIVAEYRAFLTSSSSIDTERVRKRVAGAASTVCKRIGKPLADWTEADMLALFPGRCKTVVYGYSAFLGFLLFRGYVRVRQLAFYDTFPFGLCRLHRLALQPIRERLELTRKQLGYASESEGGVGTVLNLLIELLVFAGKELTELTRADFEAFRTVYDQWYQDADRRANGSNDARLSPGTLPGALGCVAAAAQGLQARPAFCDPAPRAVALAHHQSHRAQVLRLAIPGSEAEHARLTRSRMQQPGEHLERRGLARAVWPQEADHFAGADPKADLLHSRHRTVMAPDEAAQRRTEATLAFGYLEGFAQPLHDDCVHHGPGYVILAVWLHAVRSVRLASVETISVAQISA
jgi:hypothetical protein